MILGAIDNVRLSGVVRFITETSNEYGFSWATIAFRAAISESITLLS